MKNFLMFLCTLFLIFSLVGNAAAIPYTDTYNANALYMEDGHWEKIGGKWWNPKYEWVDDATIGWTFDITDGVDGFNPDTQDITSASVMLNFSDDFNCPVLDWSEYADLDIGTNEFSWEVDNGDISFEITSLMTLSDTGTINAILTATKGDFIFNSATLTADGTPAVIDPPAPVPEPATMFLLGFGLIGLAAIRRKKK